MPLRPAGRASLLLLTPPALWLLLAPPPAAPVLGPVVPVRCPVPIESARGLRCLEVTEAAAARLGPGDVVPFGQGPPARMAPLRLLAAGASIELRLAPPAELEALPGVGPRLAERLAESRPRDRDELARLLGARRAEALAPYVAF